MPCPSGPVGAEQNVPVEDLLFVHPFQGARRYQPRNRGEFVAAVMQTEGEGRSLRALGSNWALSGAGVASDVIDTSLLSQHLSRPFPNRGQALAPSRLRGSGSDFLQQSCVRDAQTSGRFFVHVEAGIKLRQLLDDLAQCGLSLPTMGDGAGQSLLGMLSTGSHGGDLRVKPLVEWIRAVHLVSATGQELWVTPSGSPFAFVPLLTQLPDWCADTRFVTDDDTFAAVRLGVGRMGAVYAVVLEVVEQYTLLETNFEYRWSELRAQLAGGRLTPTGQTGVFDAPLTDLDSGFFRTEVLRRTYYPAVVQDAKFTYVRGPEKWPNVPAYFDAHPEVYTQVLADLKLTTLADDLRGGPAMRLHHVDIGIPLTEPERCWVRRRWKRPQPVRAYEVAPTPDDDLTAAVKANKKYPPGIVDAVKDRLEVDPLIRLLDLLVEPDPLLNFIAWLTYKKKLARLNWYLDHEIANLAQQHLAIGATSGEELFLALYRVATDSVLDAGKDVGRAVSAAIGGAFARLARAGNASGALYQNMLDAHDYGLDGAQCGNSAEFHFDAAGGTYLEFIDDVIALAGSHFPVFGYIGVRFTPAASALIAMQQFALTASVEVATARSRLEDVYAGFWVELHDAARARQGIPHWGQEFTHTEAELAALYGPRLKRWRAVLADVCGGAPQVFSTEFSRSCGLEPLAGAGDDDAIDIFMAALAGAEN
jgi:hypothetical protein